MENTLENKARFFAQYWGQKLLSSFMFGDLVKIQSFYLHAENIRAEDFLKLKPLSLITDEDLLAAINILDSKDEFTELGSLEIGKEIIQIVADINSEVARNDIHPQYIFHFSDYLRSKGYALPWMGLSVETLKKYGWIKLKTD